MLIYQIPTYVCAGNLTYSLQVLNYNLVHRKRDMVCMRLSLLCGTSSCLKETLQICVYLVMLHDFVNFSLPHIEITPPIYVAKEIARFFS